MNFHIFGPVFSDGKHTSNQTSNIPKDNRAFQLNADTLFVFNSLPSLSRNSSVAKKFVPRLHGFCGEAIDSVTSVITQLHMSSFILEFKTLF